jgi:hypothetical protein
MRYRHDGGTAQLEVPQTLVHVIPLPYVRIRQDTSGYVRIRQDTSADVRILKSKATLNLYTYMQRESYACGLKRYWYAALRYTAMRP